MSGSHRADAHHLYVDGDTPVHRLAPDAKLAGMLAFVIVVALTPRRWVGAIAVDAAVLVGVVALARLRVRTVLARLGAVLPFLLFALAIPFVGTGDTTEVLGVHLSVEGLWATWNIVAKTLLGATASAVVVATTPIPAVVRGLGRLRVPRLLVAIVAFMFRYMDLLVDQLRRMRTAMAARCHDPRWLWQARPIAASAGALFVRSYERGERVHRAMLARGYRGTMPALDARRTRAREWLGAAAPALLAITAAIATAVTT